MGALVYAVCAGLAGGSELGGQTAVAGRTKSRGVAAPSGRAPARAVGLEPGQCDGTLAPRRQKLVYSSLAPHSIQLGCAVSICVLTSADFQSFEKASQTELLCSQPTTGKPLTNRAPLGQAAPDSPVGTLSRHFLLEKATATLWWPPLLAPFLSQRKNAAKSPLTNQCKFSGDVRPFTSRTSKIRYWELASKVGHPGDRYSYEEKCSVA